MVFILFNIALFIASSVLIYSGFLNFSVFMTLPLGLEILIVIGLITPIMNLYDTIRNLVALATLLGGDNEE